MDEFFANFESVHASFIINDVEDYSQYGLDSPTATLTVKAGDEETNLKFGTFSTMDSKRYVENDEGVVYLIDDDLVEYLDTDRDSFLRTDKLYDYDTVSALTVTGSAVNMDVKYLPDETHDYTDAWDYYMVDGEKYSPVETSRLNTFLSELTEMSMDEYETYTASEADIEKCGLDNPAVSITVEGSMDEADEDEPVAASYTVRLSNTGEDKFYARVDDSSIIYKLDEDTYNSLAEISYNTIRPDSVVTLEDVEVTGFTVESESDTFEVAVDKGWNDETTYTMDGEEADLSEVMEHIGNLPIDTFDLDEDAQAFLADGLSDPEMTITLKLDNENYDTLTICFYRYNGDDSFVTLNGETLGLVKREKMVEIKEGLIL